MQEQTPSDPPRREPSAGARRRSPKATFTPPPASAKPADTGQGEGTDAPPGKRRPAKAAPTVLFQPPTPEQPLPRQAGATRKAAEAATPPGTDASAPETGPTGTSAPETGPAGNGNAAPPPGPGEDTRPTDEPATVTPTTPTVGNARKRSTPRTRQTTRSTSEASGTTAPPAPGTDSTPAAAARTSTGKRADGQRVGRSRKAADPADPALTPAPVAAGTAEPTGPVSSGTATAAPAAAPDNPGTPPARKSAKKATPRKATASRAAESKATEDKAPESKTTEDKATGSRTAEPKRSTPKKAAPRKAPAEPSDVTQDAPTPAVNTVAPALATEQPADGPSTAALASGRTRELGLAELRSRLVAHPGFAPELLALAAVAGIGPRARDWAQRLRAAYPDAGPDGLARLASRRFVRMAGAGGAAAAVAGLFAPVAELAAVLWSQAGLVLHVAAAYERDPLDPERAVELLVLTQVHPDPTSARTALAAARAADGPGDQPWPRAAEAAWRLAAPLAAQAGGWAALRLASRLLPGAAVLAAAAGDAAAAERLAARAVGVYRPVRAS